MRLGLLALLTALALGAAACGGGGGSAASTTTAVGAALTLSPASLQQGQTVSISGSAGDCPPGDAVTVISKAFPHTQDFAGVAAVTATVQSDGSFSTSTAIPSTTQPGTYDVTARCGGGNLGLLLHLTVTG